MTSPVPGREARILVAEPSRTLAALIRAALGELGAEIEVAPDGAAALAAARARAPDVLVCDQGLPGLDGYALAHAMKQLVGPKKLATLLLVPDHATPDAERLAYVGITDVLTKPFERAVLLERVRGLLAGIGASARGLPGAERARAPLLGEPATARTPRPHGFDAAPGPSREPPAEGRASVASARETLEPLVSEVVDARLEARLGQLVSQRLPALLDAALARLLPTAVLEATQRAVAERVPAAVEGAARMALAEVATPTRIDRLVGDIARQATEKAVADALAPLLGGAVEAVKARVEGELLGRLDNFARTELPARLSAHAEQIVWRVVPTIAEDLVKEEIKRLTAE